MFMNTTSIMWQTYHKGCGRKGFLGVEIRIAKYFHINVALSIFLPKEKAARYVKGFPNEWDDEKLNAVFGEYGKITSSCIMADPKGCKFTFVNHGLESDI